MKVFKIVRLVPIGNNAEYIFTSAFVPTSVCAYLEGRRMEERGVVYVSGTETRGIYPLSGFRTLEDAHEFLHVVWAGFSRNFIVILEGEGEEASPLDVPVTYARHPGSVFLSRFRPDRVVWMSEHVRWLFQDGIRERSPL
jgi:hypothetical protein